MFQETVPVYLITGFLEGGKTQFLRYTMDQDYFKDGSKTLIILCEEGEEEYDPVELADQNAVVVLCDEKERLTAEWLREQNKKYRPERVMIEYNGMWSVKEFLETKQPDSWELYQTITILDGSQFQLYLNNIKAMVIELVTYSDMIVFNRCTKELPLDTFARSIKAVNRQAELVFENESGELEQPAGVLPYDVEADIIEVQDADYGIWYIDVQEHPERYTGKQIRFRAMCLTSDEFPNDVFVPGRNVMTCCADDIRFLGFACKYSGVKNLKKRQWLKVSATLKFEDSKLYGGQGPVLYANDIVLTGKPEVEVVSF